MLNRFFTGLPCFACTILTQCLFSFVFNRKIKVSGASDLASKAQVSSDTSNLKVKGEPEASFRPEMKVRCVCGSSLETESMIQVMLGVSIPV